MPDAILSVEKFAVGYGKSPIVSGIDFSVRSGEIFTLIGPNGAGKSTMLKSIAGQLEPLGGSAYLSGRPLSKMTPREMALELSVMLTERLRTELLTCSDVVEMGRYPYTGRLGILAPEDREIVRQSMDEASVWDLRDRDFMQVSDGQRQRVLLARAICQRPRVMILDEPTNYLDIHYQIELLNVLRRLARVRGVAIVMSLHELSLAREASDRVACVKEGAIWSIGTPDEIFVPEVINGLYDLEPGTYDPASGSIALKGALAFPSSTPQIAGN